MYCPSLPLIFRMAPAVREFMANEPLRDTSR